MNREFIIAISLGFTVGLVVMYGVWTANRSMKEFETVSPIPTNPVQIDNQAVSSDSNESKPYVDLVVTEPYKNLLTREESITVSGVADPGDALIILTEVGQFVLTPNDAGEYSQEIELEKGINTISVFAVSQQNEIQQEDRIVTLSS